MTFFSPPDWLHEALDGSLPPDEVERRLQADPAARARYHHLLAVERLLHNPPLARPRPGFRGRVQARLEAHRQALAEQHRRSVWGALALGVGAFAVSGASVVGLPVLAVLAWWLLQNGAALPLAANLAGLAPNPADWAALAAAANGLLTGARVLANWLVGPAGCALLTLAAGMVVLWAVMVRRLTFQLLRKTRSQ